jgi:hypothetical protein
VEVVLEVLAADQQVPPSLVCLDRVEDVGLAGGVGALGGDDLLDGGLEVVLGVDLSCWSSALRTRFWCRVRISWRRWSSSAWSWEGSKAVMTSSTPRPVSASLIWRLCSTSTMARVLAFEGVVHRLGDVLGDAGVLEALASYGGGVGVLLGHWSGPSSWLGCAAS